MPTTKPRFCISVSDELLKRIDDFRFENRYASRTAAAVELIRLGVEHLEKAKEDVQINNAALDKDRMNSLPNT